MFFKKKEEEVKEIELEEKPLNYWEEESYILIPNDKEVTRDDICNRLSKVDGLKIEGIAEPSDDKPGRIVFKYLKNNYEVNYFINDDFKMPELFEYQKKEFSNDEVNDLYKCKYSIVLFMEFSDNFKMEYKVQLMIGSYFVDKLYGILDESAEKLLHPKYVNMIINSNYLPSTDSLFSIQAVVDNDKIWLHTHGLCRCGFSEIEILNSNNNDYNSHYHLISTLANRILDEGTKDDNAYFVGYLCDEIPLVVALLPWTEGLLYYKDIDLGGVSDREIEHNTNTSIIFVYEKEQDIEDRLVSKLELYDGQWDNDPVFFYTTEETIRMSSVAQERINYLIDCFKDKENSIIMKIGVVTDNGIDCEHMWFELIDILDNNEFKVKLISEPYNVSNMHEGDELVYGIDSITDWIIYTKNFSVTPDKVYLLD